MGTIDYEDGTGNKVYVATEQILVFKNLKPSSFEIKNPYDTELINYLQIRLDSGFEKDSLFEKKGFDFQLQNQLFAIFDTDDFKILIGIFSGRSEGIYSLKNKKNGVFAFVINGAFEFQNRLLESRDGLSINGASELEFEALSEKAILLIIETSP